MNLFGGFGNGFGGGHERGGNCICTLVWLIFLLSICGNGCDFMPAGDNCMCLIFLLLLLSCCGCNTPCGNN